MTAILRFPVSAEIQDRIMLSLDFNSLLSLFPFCSDFVKESTEHHYIYDAALKSKNVIRNIKWLLEEKSQSLESIWCSALSAGNLEVVKLLYELGYDLTIPDYMSLAFAVRGNGVVADWLFKRVSVEDSRLIWCAAVKPTAKISITQWFLRNGWVLSEAVISEAAMNGNLRLVKWLLRNNCPRPDNLLYCAKISKHKPLVRWIKKHAT